jgi:hypothetical protein
MKKRLSLWRLLLAWWRGEELLLKVPIGTLKVTTPMMSGDRPDEILARALAAALGEEKKV